MIIIPDLIPDHKGSSEDIKAKITMRQWHSELKICFKYVLRSSFGQS